MLENYSADTFDSRGLKKSNKVKENLLEAIFKRCSLNSLLLYSVIYSSSTSSRIRLKSLLCMQFKEKKYFKK
jgi:hypothetical protein